MGKSRYCGSQLVYASYSRLSFVFLWNLLIWKLGESRTHAALVQNSNHCNFQSSDLAKGLDRFCGLFPDMGY